MTSSPKDALPPFALPLSREQRKKGFFLAWMERILAWQERASQRHHLAELSARRLADVGLEPGELAAEIKKPFWKG